MNDMKYCALCSNTECRCGDCFALVEKDGKWYCEEYNKYCVDVKCCYLYEESEYCENFKKWEE